MFSKINENEKSNEILELNESKFWKYEQKDFLHHICIAWKHMFLCIFIQHENLSCEATMLYLLGFKLT